MKVKLIVMGILLGVSGMVTVQAGELESKRSSAAWETVGRRWLAWTDSRVEEETKTFLHRCGLAAFAPRHDQHILEILRREAQQEAPPCCVWERYTGVSRATIKFLIESSIGALRSMVDPIWNRGEQEIDVRHDESIPAGEVAFRRVPTPHLCANVLETELRYRDQFYEHMLRARASMLYGDYERIAPLGGGVPLRSGRALDE